MRRGNFLTKCLGTLLFTTLGFLVMGYHPGAEDDGVYLTAIKANLNPNLFPHDSDFFRLQLQATVFDGWMAHFVHITGIPVAWAELLWQYISLYLILWAVKGIAEQLFSEREAQWGAVAMVAAMFTLPVAGTALYLVDQHLHPRNMATALILIAISWLMKGRRWQPLPLLVLAMFLHPIMACLGISFCVFLVVVQMAPARMRVPEAKSVVAAAMPLGWIFEPPSATWREALSTRTYYFVFQWAWYEWLGVIAPLVLFALLWRVAKKRTETLMAQLSLSILAYGVFQLLVAMIMLGPAAFVRLAPFQPMRFLHLIYIFLCLIAGGFMGKYLLKRDAWRWAVLLLAANGGMFFAQRELFAATPHLELPPIRTTNPWLEAFDWVRVNTPADAYFALDPQYMAAPGEDYHSFRALAERSMLSDAVKDAAVVTQVPRLAPVWHEQQMAMTGWEHFDPRDFERLKAQFGVGWVIVVNRQTAGLDCRWHDAVVSVCEIP